MEQPKQNIDKILKDRFGNHAENPPAEIWASLEKRLANDPAGRRGFSKWFWFGALVLILSLIVFLGVYQPWAVSLNETANNKGVQEGQANNSSSKPLANNIEHESVSTGISEKNETLGDKPKEVTTNEEKVDIPVKDTKRKEGNISAVHEPVTQQPVGGQNSSLQGNHTERSGKQTAIQSKTNNIIISDTAQPVTETILNNTHLTIENKTNVINSNESKEVAVTSAIPLDKPLDSSNDKPIKMDTAVLAMNRAEKAVMLNSANDHPVVDSVSPAVEKSTLQSLPDSLNSATTKGSTINNDQASIDPPVAKPTTVLAVGIKLGYEKMLSDNGYKYLLSPFLEYKFSKRVSILFQPGIKYGKSNVSPVVSPDISYYRIQSSVFDSSSVVLPGPPMGATPDTIYRTYAYTQVYDSIVTGQQIKNKPLWEIELPVLLKYAITKNISVLGGVTMQYSNILQVEESRKEYNSITISDTTHFAPELYYLGAPASEAPPVESFETKFVHNNQPYSNYEGIKNSPATLFRFGFAAGFSGQIKNRFLVDAMIQQSLSPANKIPNEKIRSIYTQPGFRLTVGYKFSK